jgi:hypothetical protein
MADLLALPDAERTLVTWLMRQRGASLGDVVAHTQAEPDAMQAMLDTLVSGGFLSVDETTDPAVFHPSLVSRKPRTVPDRLWSALE